MSLIMTGDLVGLTRATIREIVHELVEDSPLMATLQAAFKGTLVLYGGFLRDVVATFYEHLEANDWSPNTSVPLALSQLKGQFGLTNLAGHFNDIDLATSLVKSSDEIIEILRKHPSIDPSSIKIVANLGGTNTYRTGSNITARSTSSDPAMTFTVTDVGKSGRTYMIQFSTASTFTHLDFSVNTLTYYFSNDYVTTFVKAVTGNAARYGDNIVYDHILNRRLLVPSFSHIAWRKFEQRAKKMKEKGYSEEGVIMRPDRIETWPDYQLNVGLTKMYILQATLQETASSGGDPRLLFVDAL